MKGGNEAEEYYDLVDNANDFIQRVTPEGKFLYVNRAWKETFGYSEEELAKLTLFNVVHPDSQAHCLEIFQRVLSGERVDGIEAVFVTKDGREIAVEGNANCYFKEGKPVATMGIFRDITERKQAEKILRESEEKYKTVVGNVNDVIFQISPLGFIQYVSPKVEEIYGYKPEELIGKHLKKTTPITEVPKALGILKRGLSGEYIKSFEINQLDSKGKIIAMEINVTPVKKDGKIIAMQGVMRDITERKQVERLEQQQKVLEISERNLRGFSRKILETREEERKRLSMDLHDEMGSMAIALGSGLKIIEEAVEDSNLQSALENVSQTKSALKKTTESLRKIAADLSPSNLGTIGLPNALREYFSNIERQTKIKIDFSVDTEKEGLSDKGVIVLYRVAQETLNNIIKHAKAKKVKARMCSRENELEFSMRDDGKGFDVNELQETEVSKMGIRGMRERVGDLKGTFVIKSAPGEGTEVSVTLVADVL